MTSGSGPLEPLDPVPDGAPDSVLPSCHRSLEIMISISEFGRKPQYHSAWELFSGDAGLK